jgi:hypothetical protein
MAAPGRYSGQFPAVESHDFRPWPLVAASPFASLSAVRPGGPKHAYPSGGGCPLLFDNLGIVFEQCFYAVAHPVGHILDRALTDQFGNP